MRGNGESFVLPPLLSGALCTALKGSLQKKERKKETRDNSTCSQSSSRRLLKQQPRDLCSFPNVIQGMRFGLVWSVVFLRKKEISGETGSRSRRAGAERHPRKGVMKAGLCFGR